MSEEPWDQDDEHRRADFEHMLERMQQDYANHIISGAEESLSRLAPSTPVPMPNTAHPALERYAEAVRSARRDPIFLPRLQSLRASFASAEAMEPIDVAPGKWVLTKAKAAAPAPFVGRYWGDEAMYVWWVWTDDLGRHVATDVELIWR